MRIQNSNNNLCQNNPNFAAVTISGGSITRRARKSLIQNAKGIRLKTLTPVIDSFVKHDAKCGDSGITIDITPASLSSVKLTKIELGEKKSSTFVSLNPISHLEIKLKKAYSGLMRDGRKQYRAHHAETVIHA